MTKRALHLEDRSRENLVQVSIREMVWALIRECPSVLVKGTTTEKYTPDTRHWELCSELMKQSALLTYLQRIFYLYPNGRVSTAKEHPYTFGVDK